MALRPAGPTSDQRRFDALVRESKYARVCPARVNVYRSCSPDTPIASATTAPSVSGVPTTTGGGTFPWGTTVNV